MTAVNLKVLYNHLKLQAYKIQSVHAIEDYDNPCRYNCAMNIFDKVNEAISFFKKQSSLTKLHFMFLVMLTVIIVTFGITRIIFDKHNRISWKLTVGVLTAYEVIGPFCFTEPMVISAIFPDMLQEYAAPQIEHWQPNVYFQQDGARTTTLEFTCLELLTWTIFLMLDWLWWTNFLPASISWHYVTRFLSMWVCQKLL